MAGAVISDLIPSRRVITDIGRAIIEYFGLEYVNEMPRRRCSTTRMPWLPAAGANHRPLKFSSILVSEAGMQFRHFRDGRRHVVCPSRLHEAQPSRICRFQPSAHRRSLATVDGRLGSANIDTGMRRKKIDGYLIDRVPHRNAQGYFESICRRSHTHSLNAPPRDFDVILRTSFADWLAPAVGFRWILHSPGYRPAIVTLRSMFRLKIIG